MKHLNVKCEPSTNVNKTNEAFKDAIQRIDLSFANKVIAKQFWFNYNLHTYTPSLPLTCKIEKK